MLNRILYEELQLRKDSGEKLEFKSITYDELVQLWWEKVVPDSEIAALYEVTKDAARKKRYKLRIKQKDMFVRDKISEFLDIS